MLLFYCAARKKLDTIRRKGVKGSGGDGVRVWTSLAAARATCSDPILVVDAAALPGDATGDGPGERASVEVPRIPPEAIRNLDPYLAPQPVIAAGGYVVRPGEDAPEVLLIYRRGAWDLPKGKQDPGEAVDACALREVREEVGIETLHLGRALGTTVHGYERGGGYHVKTTYWFLMQTPETQFTPEEREGIEEVAWVSWPEAVQRIDYPSFRAHMQRIEQVVREAVRA